MTPTTAKKIEILMLVLFSAPRTIFQEELRILSDPFSQVRLKAFLYEPCL